MRRAVVLVVVAVSAAGVVTAAGGVSPRSSGTIVFESNRAGNHEIYSVRADGSGLRRLTITIPGSASEGHDAMWPRWSPDGKRIVFQTGPEALLTSGQIFVMNADGRGRRRLTTGDPVTSANVMPAWSPNGRMIAYVSVSAGDTRIFVMDANGRHRRAITPRGQVVRAPAWSPDGKRIVWRCFRGGRSAICAVPVTGGAAKTIWKAPDGFLINESLRWSPDGRRIAFSGASLGSDIYVIEAGGKGLRRLTTDGASASPAWSPDGRQIVFASDRNYRSLLYVMYADGTRQTRLTGNPGQDEAPDWSAAVAGPRG